MISRAPGDFQLGFGLSLTNNLGSWVVLEAHKIGWAEFPPAMCAREPQTLCEIGLTRNLGIKITLFDKRVICLSGQY